MTLLSVEDSIALSMILTTMALSSGFTTSSALPESASDRLW